MAGTRYVRYIAFALVSLIVIFFISSSSNAPGSDSIRDYGKSLKGKWRGQSSTTPSDSMDYLDPSNSMVQKPAARPGTTPNTSGGLGLAKIGPTMNATFVTLARNSDVWEIAKSIRAVEDRFNRKFGYDWVFLNDKPFDETFKKITTALVSGNTRYGLIPEDHWSFPEWIDQDKAAEVRKDMAERKIIYGDSISYRHMCRYESGFFFRHPLMLEYEWYWRVEPSIELYCDIDYDTFEFMAKNDKKYSFVISMYEYKETILTMWDSAKKFMKEHPEHLAKDNSLDFLSNDGGDSYNQCHFWSNFEIGNLNWLRSPAYIDFFDQLDKDGGFFYERWGDAPVHSIGAGLTLKKDQIHFFNDIAYYHIPFTHCPIEEDLRVAHKCHCSPDENFDWNGYSCTARWFEFMGMDKPKGAPLSSREKRNRILLGVLFTLALLAALAGWALTRTSNKEVRDLLDLAFSNYARARREYRLVRSPSSAKE
ncbi:MAG: alpha 1,2-mannosyltransferase 2.4.1 [Chrysothrix sp. TS-e1954]|nr:MAG: alpha 1,2-mannosyltransferase 2.4.1 [Chrysothrix sp. TS-e1954]